jgi:integrase
MKVYKRPESPTWQLAYRDPTSGDRKRVSLGYQGSKQNALARAEEFLARAREEVHSKRVHGETITVQAAVEKYIEHLASNGRVSAVERRLMAGKTFGTSVHSAHKWHLDGTLNLHELTSAHMEQLVQARRKEGCAAQTIAHELSMIRSAARYLAELGYRMPDRLMNGTAKNPWRVPEVDKKTRYLSWDEFKLVYDYLDPDRPLSNGRRLGGKQRQWRQDCQDLLVALAMCGGRWSEVASLTWDRVDFDNHLIRLWGNKDKEERLVPLPSPFYAVLQRRRSTCHPTSPLVFAKFDGSRRTAPSDGVRAAMRACGLDRADLVAAHGHATIHSLRHTFASWLIQNGADLSEVQEALGHSSLEMTRRYASLAKRKTVAKLGGILNAIGAQP